MGAVNPWVCEHKNIKVEFDSAQGGYVATCNDCAFKGAVAKKTKALAYVHFGEVLGSLARIITDEGLDPKLATCMVPDEKPDSQIVQTDVVASADRMALIERLMDGMGLITEEQKRITQHAREVLDGNVALMKLAQEQGNNDTVLSLAFQTFEMLEGCFANLAEIVTQSYFGWQELSRAFKALDL